MLSMSIQRIRDTTVIRCCGRLVVGENLQWFRKVVFSQKSTASLVLDLADVCRIDAGGLGFLLELQELTRAQLIRFRLMNVVNEVDRVIRLTRLDEVFEFCSVHEMLRLACLAHTDWTAQFGDFTRSGGTGRSDTPAA